MNLLLQREIKTPQFTLGILLGAGKKLAYTCEDVVRGHGDAATVADWKIPDVTAIPYGRYRVIVDFSQHFQKHLPHLLDVPGFSGVRFHGGNTAAASSGCILLGLSRTKDGVKNCAPAVDALMELIAGSTGEVWLEIVDA